MSIPLRKAEKALGRVKGSGLPRGVCVHHFDENNRNHANTNLVICENQKYHQLLHARQQALREGVELPREGRGYFRLYLDPGMNTVLRREAKRRHMSPVKIIRHLIREWMETKEKP